MFYDDSFFYIKEDKKKSQRTQITERYKTGCNKIYKSILLTPVLQTEPISLLMILGLLCAAGLYLNNSLTYAQGIGLVWDALAQFMSIFLTVSAACANGLACRSLKRFSRYEFILILWLSLLGMLSMIKSDSFLGLYLSLELQGLSFYMLAAMRSRAEASAEAGLKYFILSAFSSAMLLLGIAVIYANLGSQSLSDLAIIIRHFKQVPNYGVTSFNVGLGCVTVSLLFKLGAAPFHAWISDVYEGSNTPITAWFAITAKIAVITVLIRLNGIFSSDVLTLVTAVAAISLAYGSLSAMRQVKLKRLIAFSAVANAGWFLLGLIAGKWQLSIIHLMVYTLLSINLFSVFVLPLFKTHNHSKPCFEDLKTKSITIWDIETDGIKYISDLHQIFKTNSSLAKALTLSMFSLAGVPPLAGFYSKYLLINALSQNQQFLLLTVTLSVAVLSAFYYLRVIKTIYFGNTYEYQSVAPLQTNALLTSYTAAFTLVFFIKPDYFCIWLELM